MGRERRALLRAALVLVVALAGAGCSGDDDADASDSPAATVGTAPTTSTTLSVEAEVEAAYLRSWDVYTEAVRTFDTSKLADVYVGDALTSRLAEINRLREANTPVRMDVDHDITITIADDDPAPAVLDCGTLTLTSDGDDLVFRRE